MSRIYNLYQSHKKSENLEKSQSIYSNDLTQTKRPSTKTIPDQMFYSQLAMQKQLVSNIELLNQNRHNSPTYRITDTINQTDKIIDFPRSSVKKAIFSDIDNIKNPQNVHVSTNLLVKDQLQMFQHQKRSKQRGEYSQLKLQSSFKQWKPSIKVESEIKTKQNNPKTVNEKRVRKPVPGQKEKQNNRNPILYPTSEDTKKLRKSVIIEKIELNSVSPGKRTFKNANYSEKMRFSLTFDKQFFMGSYQQKPTGQFNPYGLEAKKLISYHYAPQFNDKTVSDKCTQVKYEERQVSFSDVNQVDFRRVKIPHDYPAT